MLGAATDGIELDTPGAGDVVASPVVLTGRAWAFEGHVSVRIVGDGFPTPLATRGAVVLTTESARDGRVRTAAVVRVALAGP